MCLNSLRFKYYHLDSFLLAALTMAVPLVCSLAVSVAQF